MEHSYLGDLEMMLTCPSGLSINVFNSYSGSSGLFPGGFGGGNTFLGGAYDNNTGNIGYCEEGRYAKMIIIPSYDNQGNLNYFTGRSFEKDPYVKYRNPEVSRDIIPNEHLINFNLPLVICEGMFDAIAIKRNAIPLLGKNIQSTLMKKIVTSTVKKLYIALDKDAQKQSLDFCKKFIDEGKEVYLVELKDKDPSEMGFKQFTNLIQKTLPLTYSNLMEKKIMLT